MNVIVSQISLLLKLTRVVQEEPTLPSVVRTFQKKYFWLAMKLLYTGNAMFLCHPVVFWMQSAT